MKTQYTYKNIVYWYAGLAEYLFCNSRLIENKLTCKDCKAYKAFTGKSKSLLKRFVSEYLLM